jgi:predicted GNAT family acetyltransferase
MAGMTQPPEVTDNSAQTRFELRIGDALAELIYRRRADRLVLVHTEVPAELGGRGIGGQLVRAALARAASADLTVVPLCPFARSWLERHPDAADGIRIDWDNR